MKYNTICIFLLVIELFSLVSSFVRNGVNNNAQTLTPTLEKSAIDKSNNLAAKNDEICEPQHMAEEMMEHMLKDNDLFSHIIDPLQNKMSNTYSCSHIKHTNMCMNEKDKVPFSLTCTSDKYEKLIDDFTNKRLCHSAIAFSNTLLKSFIDPDKNANTFERMIASYKTVLTCIDSDLKDIYNKSMSLFSDLRDAIVKVVKAGSSQKIIEVLKKREKLITSVFCELRKGANSKIVSSGLVYEFFTILKVDAQDLLDEAYVAFSDYYQTFPNLAKTLLEKDGLLDRLTYIHEQLTIARTKSILDKINKHAKDEVINNEALLKQFDNYKHHHTNGSSTFVQQNEVIMNKNSQNVNTLSAKVYNNNSDVNKVQIPAQKTVVQNISNSDHTQENDELKNNSDAIKVQIPTKQTVVQNTSNSDHTQENDELKNTLYSTDKLPLKNVKDLTKELINDIGVVKFDKGEPTEYIDEIAVKKLIEIYFLDLTNNTMLVHMLLKPQAALLLIIQSFINMTPSPKKDAISFCKKSLVDNKLVDVINPNQESDEDKLIKDFAAKYNAIYEEIKMEETKEEEKRIIDLKNKPTTLSALQVQNKNKPDSSQGTSSSNTSLIAMLSEKDGVNVEELVNENVQMKNLEPDIDNAYQPFNVSSTLYIKTSFGFLFFVAAFICFL
ncbi:GPI-anchored micronemal antigen, putative [Hepatocystis sp. ex Piliocolobus tephrosceles]|nr:GPI-anchored micronemal antigen, putative [Hepatocystis sp. ex Piliocolobus tephrosceles]